MRWPFSRGSKKLENADNAPDRAKVFICYARVDAEFVDLLESALERQSIGSLIDRGEIGHFEDWWDRIKDLIVKSDALVFVMSPDSIGSRVCNEEIGFARSLNKRIAPILYRGSESPLPDHIHTLQYVDFQDRELFEISCDQLASGLTANLNWVRQHTEIGEAARKWEVSKHHSGFLLRTPLLQQAENWVANCPSTAPAITALQNNFIARSRKGLRNRILVRTGASIGALVGAILLSANFVLFGTMTFNESARTGLIRALTEWLSRNGSDEQRIESVKSRIALLKDDYRKNSSSKTLRAELFGAYSQLSALYYSTKQYASAYNTRLEEYVYAAELLKLEPNNANSQDQIILSTIGMADALQFDKDADAATRYYDTAIRYFRRAQVTGADSYLTDIEMVRVFADRSLATIGDGDGSLADGLAKQAIELSQSATKKKATYIDQLGSQESKSSESERSEARLSIFKGGAIAASGLAQTRKGNKSSAEQLFEEASRLLKVSNKGDLESWANGWLGIVAKYYDPAPR